MLNNTITNPTAVTTTTATSTSTMLANRASSSAQRKDKQIRNMEDTLRNLVAKTMHGAVIAATTY
jgi:hypothetical protein